MSPPAAWKRRLRCGLVGFMLMRGDGVRRAEAGSSTHDAHAVSMQSDARMMQRCERSQRRVLSMQSLQILSSIRSAAWLQQKTRAS